MPRLSKAEIEVAMRRVPGWMIEQGALTRVFRLETFPVAIAFVDRIALMAEEMGHHPDLDIRYTKVKVALTTHDVGGISELDFALAERISLAD